MKPRHDMDHGGLVQAQLRLRFLEKALLELQWQRVREGKVRDESGLSWRVSDGHQVLAVNGRSSDA